MPHSLVAKLSGLKHKGFITEVEYDRLRKGLNYLKVDEMYQLEMENAEEFIAKSVLDKIRAEILEYIDDLDIADVICEVFDKYEADIKEVQFERIWNHTVKEMKRRKIGE